MKNLLPTLLILSFLTPSLSLAQEVESARDDTTIPVYFFLTTEDPPFIVAVTPITEDIIAYAIAPLDITTTPLTYDNNGNQTGNGSSTYAFDYRNRMTDSTVNSAASSYSYDSNNERAVIAQGSSATHYPNTLYNISGPTPIKHIFLNGNMLATVQGGWGNGILYYTHTDHLTGSNVVSDSGAHLAELTDYLPYGSIRTDDRINGYAEQRKYIGQEFDTQTSLSYLNARYYNSATGQFISEDPSFLGMGASEITPRLLVDPQLQNSYSYGRDNPLSYRDPDGNTPLLLVGAGVLYGVASQYFSDLQEISAGRQQNLSSFGEYAYSAGKGIATAVAGEFGIGWAGVTSFGLSVTENKIFRQPVNLINATVDAVGTTITGGIIKQLPGSLSSLPKITSSQFNTESAKTLTRNSTVEISFANALAAIAVQIKEIQQRINELKNKQK